MYFAPQDVDDADKDEDEEDGWNEEDCEDKQAGFQTNVLYLYVLWIFIDVHAYTRKFYIWHKHPHVYDCIESCPGKWNENGTAVVDVEDNGRSKLTL